MRKEQAEKEEIQLGHLIVREASWQQSGKIDPDDIATIDHIDTFFVEIKARVTLLVLRLEGDLPKHPLETEGYLTMGDWHSTRKPQAGETAEETRFGGQKYECGLHEESGQNDFQI